ncbi:MAG: Fic/DOC family N-terminal domain-containing protein [Geminicoccaceae bacterium]
MARIDALASELRDPYLISRVLTRREAVSSSAIEGTNSTLEELLAVEETGDADATDAARQVHDYAVALEDLVPRAQEQGPAVFTVPLVQQLHRNVMRGVHHNATLPWATNPCRNARRSAEARLASGGPPKPSG